VGIGGMGVVYRAKAPKIGKTVAIKVLRAEVMEDPREMERFLDEARAVAAISHRGIIDIYGSGELADGRQYLVMEFLRGEGLDAKLKREGRVAAAEVIPILEEITSALQGVHNAGIVHRDLKPGNVFLVQQDDGRPWVKLLDFGLARRGERTDVSRIAGTPDYLSPEHSRGLAAGPPSDFYALGVMTFQLLTGKLPFTGRTPLEVMEKHVYDDPPNAVAIEPSIPDALADLLKGLLRKEPSARPDVIQIKALLKQAARQVRSAGTQPGADVVVRPTDVIDSPPTPVALDAGPAGARVKSGEGPVLERLPRALAGRAPSSSANLSTPTPAEAPTEEPVIPSPSSRTLSGDKRTLRFIYMAIGAVVAVAVAIVTLNKLNQDRGDEELERRRRTPGKITPPTTSPEGLVPMPEPRPREEPEEPMPENPAAAN
jgi:serine/threonine-protein kinase